MKIAALGICCLSWIMATDVALARTWTDNRGRTMEAEFMDVRDGIVFVILENGKMFRMSLDTLSKADQEWVAVMGQQDDQLQNGRQGASRILRGDGPKAEKTWPTKVALDGTPEVEVVESDRENNKFIYRTEHYEFHSDIRLSKSVIREFGRIFEATYLLNCKLPLDLAPHAEPGQKFFEAHIFETREDYMKAGGWPGSGGVYMYSLKKFLVPIESLGVVNRGSRVTIDYDFRDFTTLIHEITHQMMNQWLGYLPVWYSEGSAVYVEMLDYHKNGRFDLSNLKSTLKEYFDGSDVKMLDPEILISMTHKEWSDALAAGKSRLNYSSAGLLAFYFYHIDGEGDAANIIQCLRNIESGKKNWKESQEELLIRGRSMDRLRKEIRVGFKLKMNLHVDFVDGNTGED